MIKKEIETSSNQQECDDGSSPDERKEYVTHDAKLNTVEETLFDPQHYSSPNLLEKEDELLQLSSVATPVTVNNPDDIAGEITTATTATSPPPPPPSSLLDFNNAKNAVTKNAKQSNSSSPPGSPVRKNSETTRSGSIVAAITKIAYDTQSSTGGNNSSKVDSNNEDSLSKSSDSSGELIKVTPPQTQELPEKPKSASKISERAKKKSWYSALYPSYKSRTQDFKKLFKDVPNDERLIVDYSCALQRDILIHGRLYVSQNYVCFHANIFRWETYLVMKWKDVTSITKEKTALVIPNAISICTQKEKHFFASFTTRDKAFLMLFRVWQNTLMDKQMPPQEIWKWVHNCYGDELGLTTDDEDYIDPKGCSIDNEPDSDLLIGEGDPHHHPHHRHQQQQEQEEQSDSSEYNTSYENSNEFCTARNIKNKTKVKINTNSSSSTTTTTATSSDNNSGGDSNKMKSDTNPDDGGGVTASSAGVISGGTSGGGGNTKLASTFDGKRKVSKNSRQRDENLSKNAETLPTDMSDSSDSEETKIPFVSTTECTSTHEGRQLVHTILPINIETLFNLLFSKSKFLLDFHAARKSTDISFGDEWTTKVDGVSTRTVNVTVALSASVGPKTSKVTEYQVMRDCSKPGELYSIDVNSVNAGIPYADSFGVLLHYCLVRTIDDHTMLSVHAQIKYKKSIWGVVKGFIEKNTWAGLEDFYNALLRSLQSETCIPPAKGKGRRPRRGTATQIRPIEEVVPLLPQQEISEKNRTINHRPIIKVTASEPTSKYKWISLFVIILLSVLILINVILLIKLWKLEDRIQEDYNSRSRMPNLSTMKQLPNNHEDWIDLLRQQEILHETELKKWHSVLQTAVELLKKVSVVCQTIYRNERLTQHIDQIDDEL